MGKEKKVIKIYDTELMWQQDGLAYLETHKHVIVWNADCLFKDIPNLLRIALEAKKDDKEKILTNIGGQLKNYFEKQYILNKHYEESENNSGPEDS